MSEFTVSRKIVDDIEEAGKSSNRPWVSFEFFPPKTEVFSANLYSETHLNSFIFASYSKELAA